VGDGTIWDGRFELTAHRAGLSAAPLQGRFSGMEQYEKAKLFAIPAPERGALPAILEPGRPPTCPILARPQTPDLGVTVMNLTAHRFRAACGLIGCEQESSASGDMANCSQPSYVGAKAKGLVE